MPKSPDRFLDQFTEPQSTVVRADIISSFNFPDLQPLGRKRWPHTQALEDTRGEVIVARRFPIRIGLDIPREHHRTRHGNKRIWGS